MRSLLDVNVLIALLDANHTLHERAKQWLTNHSADGWASSPITQNGCLRVMSNPAYANTMPVSAVVARLADACRDALHAFWPDDITLLRDDVADATRLHGARQLTDVYLLALAVHHGGRFVTFDRAVPRDAARGAKQKHLLVL